MHPGLHVGWLISLADCWEGLLWVVPGAMWDARDAVAPGLGDTVPPSFDCSRRSSRLCGFGLVSRRAGSTATNNRATPHPSTDVGPLSSPSMLVDEIRSSALVRILRSIRGQTIRLTKLHIPCNFLGAICFQQIADSIPLILNGRILLLLDFSRIRIKPVIIVLRLTV